MPTPNIPPGLDFLDPDLCVKGLPIKEKNLFVMNILKETFA